MQLPAAPSLPGYSGMARHESQPRVSPRRETSPRCACTVCKTARQKGRPIAQTTVQFSFFFPSPRRSSSRRVHLFFSVCLIFEFVQERDFPFSSPLARSKGNVGSMVERISFWIGKGEALVGYTTAFDLTCRSAACF